MPTTLDPAMLDTSSRSTEHLRGSPTDSPTDLRRSSRWLAALLLPVGPIAVAVLRFILPYRTIDDSGAVVAGVAGRPDTESAVLWLAFIATFTLVPAVLWVGRLTRRRAPRLTAAAVLLAVPGYLALTWMISRDLLLWSGVQAGLDAGALVRLDGAAHPTTALAAGIFVLGHVLGSVLLGLALWRSRAVPAWAAALMLVSQPLHFLAAVILASPPVDLMAWGLNAVAFVVVARAILRLSDQDWDLPPVRRTSGAAL